MCGNDIDDDTRLFASIFSHKPFKHKAKHNVSEDFKHKAKDNVSEDFKHPLLKISGYLFLGLYK